jgi:hypothetical protein
MINPRGMAILAAVGIAGAANASVVNFVSNPGLEQLGAFTGSMEWTYLGDNAGTLEITLTNTSPVDNGGYLTGLAFRAVYNDSLKIVYASDHENWLEVIDENCSPWGVFDHGAAVGGDWTGGGQPSAGIGVGETWSFLFDVRGDPTLLASIVAHDFFDESDGWGFAARFRGFEDGGSDKVNASLPAPGVLTALAMGAAGSRRRRR